MTRHRGRRDQAARARLEPQVLAGTATCWQCGDPVTPDQAWDAGHVEDLVDGGDPAGLRLVEHALKADCRAGGNRRRGALAQVARRAGKRTRLEEWLA